MTVDMDITELVRMLKSSGVKYFESGGFKLEFFESEPEVTLDEMETDPFVPMTPKQRLGVKGFDREIP